MTDLKFIGGESDSAYADRVKDRNGHVATCNKAKHSFANQIGKSKSMLTKLAHHDFVKSVVNDIDDDLAQKAASYKGKAAVIYAESNPLGQARPSSTEQDALEKASASTLASYKASAAAITKAKGNANVNKAMLLQIGKK
jgi:hypothetical protein